ncbi:hypothetical protein EC991_002217 [Linnemannia zychae]|nr:hypothetical protein EC991_002217 [Linnemannia zychae]
MANQDTHTKMQAVRRINENQNSTSEAVTAVAVPLDIIHVAYYQDPSTGKDIIIWDDILDAFKAEVVHVRSGTFVLPFLKGPDFKKLDPLRLTAVPGATLDVVIRNQPNEQELSMRSLQNALPDTPQESFSKSSSAKKAPTVASVATTADSQIEATSNKGADIDDSAATIETSSPPPPYGGLQAQQDSQATSTPTETEGGHPGNSQTAAQSPENDAPPEGDTPQEENAPQKRPLTAAQKFVEAQLKATLGDKDAQYTLGEMYECGQGTVQSDSQAFEWYSKAAEQGHMVAQYALGKCYQNGEGVSKDLLSAARCFKRAADQGYVSAQYEMGFLYSHSSLYRSSFYCPNYKTAVEWYEKAGAQGHIEAQYCLGTIHFKGQVSGATDSKAFEWYLRAANLGHVAASTCVGNQYCIGRGVSQDYSKAAKWYLKAAVMGDKEAQNSLAMLYEIGLGVPEDRTKATEWYRVAANKGHDDAKKALKRLNT